MKKTQPFEKELIERTKFLNKNPEWRKLYNKFRYISSCNAKINLAMIEMGLALYGEDKLNKIFMSGIGYPKLYIRMFRDCVAIVNKVGKLQRHLEFKTKYQRPIIKELKTKGIR